MQRLNRGQIIQIGKAKKAATSKVCNIQQQKDNLKSADET